MSVQLQVEDTGCLVMLQDMQDLLLCTLSWLLELFF